MDNVSIEELVYFIQQTQYRITNLRLTGPSSSVQRPGDVLKAGTVLYCRPSKADRLIQRLGGSSKVTIIDTDETRGFCCGSYVEPESWTNRVYPTNIGPSCAGITSDDGRKRVSTNNNCITPTSWNPIKMFSGGKKIPATSISSERAQVTRTLWLFKESVSLLEWLFKYKGNRISTYGNFLNPYYNGNDWVGEDSFYTESSGFIITPAYDVADIPNMTLVPLEDNNQDTVWSESVSFGGYWTELWPDDELCLVQMPVNVDGGLVLDPQTETTNLPQRVSIFQVNSNTIENAQQTPVLVYGGYDRKNNASTGPTPRWGRTNLIQIKTLVDVIIQGLDSEETSRAQRKNIRDRK